MSICGVCGVDAEAAVTREQFDAVIARAQYLEHRERTLAAALKRIQAWDGDEEFLDDVEVELKTIAREALADRRKAV